MPTQVSIEMARSASVFPAAAKSRRWLSRDSSASWEACQKKRYGLMVVPNTATTISIKSRSNDSVGMKVATATSPHGTFTLNAAAT